MVSGWLLLLAGVTAALHMAVPPVLRFVLMVLWLAEAGRSLLAHGRAYRRFRRFSFGADGVGWALGPNDASRIALLPGSLLLHHAAWLRFETAEKHRYGELVLRGDLSRRDWRYLNILWRHGSLCTHRGLSD